MIYLSGAASVIGLFVAGVTLDKLLVVSGLAGGLGYLRSRDKAAGTAD